ncbi:MAG: hypothetical protein KF681_15970 [Bdellovibrionaceae bacterium]|nr:hypothetical protein [Pseudobdellovibrionaceae bacterium]
MQRVRFKSYWALATNGKLVQFDTSTFDESNLQEMLAQPPELKALCFQAAHQIHGKYAYSLFKSSDPEDMKRLIAFVNLGFAKALASLGYRCLPKADEIEFL